VSDVERGDGGATVGGGSELRSDKWRRPCGVVHYDIHLDCKNLSCAYELSCTNRTHELIKFKEISDSRFVRNLVFLLLFHH
jgi:hypothetical protein